MKRPRQQVLLLALWCVLVAGCSGGTDEAATDTEGSESQQDVADAASSEEENGDGDEEGDADGDKEKPKRRERATSVDAAKVFRGELVVPVIAEGTIRTRRAADVRAEIGGRIDRIHVTEGQAVRKGQKIAELDGREYRILMEEAHARYLNALSQIAVEQENLGAETDTGPIDKKLEELDQLEAAGKITRAERRSREVELGVEALRSGHYRRELIEARSGLNQARADEERARLNLSRTVIVAPFAGVISKLTLSEGHLITTGETICSLVDNVDVEAEVGVLESDLGGLEIGRPALLHVPALGETLRVKVDVISPEIDATSRTCSVLLRVRSEDGHVRPGMYVRAAIAGKIYPDKLLVPNEALLTRDGRPLVFRVEDDQAKWVYVRLGLRNDRFSEVERVLQGGPLDPGTLVVISNHLTLTHDAKVKVRRVVDNRVAWVLSGQSDAEP